MNQKMKNTWVKVPVLIMATFVVLIASQDAFAEANSFIEIQYSINVGEDRYFIHYNVCAGEKSIVSPSIILESEQDTVQVDSTKIIRENSCQGFESFIDTKSPQLVKITIVE